MAHPLHFAEKRVRGNNRKSNQPLGQIPYYTWGLGSLESCKGTRRTVTCVQMGNQRKPTQKFYNSCTSSGATPIGSARVHPQVVE